VRFSWTSQKTVIPPMGLFGGKAGTPNRWVLKQNNVEEQILDKAIGTAELKHSDSVTCEMAGGGGYGNPLERDPKAVQEDVRMGFVSLSSARDDYGVSIHAETFAIQMDETMALRDQLNKNLTTQAPVIPIVHQER
jgi:N-methylhydantoinase B